MIRQRSDYFRAQLNELCSKLEFVREVRVRGLMIGIELKCLKDSNPQLGGVSLLMPGETLNINFSCPIWRDSTLPTLP